MEVRDLIAALQQFQPTDRVCVEIETEHARQLDGDDWAINFTVQTCERENDGTHGVKLTLEL